MVSGRTMVMIRERRRCTLIISFAFILFAVIGSDAKTGLARSHITQTALRVILLRSAILIIVHFEKSEAQMRKVPQTK